MAELRTPQGHTLLLPEGCVSIGADPANEVPVAAHLGLAPVHFRLQPWEGGHFLEDAGSGLGTLVNGHPVNWKPLNPGDVIVAGELEVVYSQDTSPASTPVPAIVAPAPPAGLMAAFPLPPPPPPLPGVAPVSSTPPPPTSDQPIHRPAIAPPALSSLPPGPTGTPPAWLPEDLLPESYRALDQPSLRTVEASAASLPPRRPQVRRRTGRRILGWAALLALLAWGGHKVWQHGHLEPFLRPLRGAAGHSLPTPVAPTHPSATPVESPSAAPPANHGTATLPPAPVPRIAGQIGR